MTAIVALKYKDGILVQSDSLAMNAKDAKDDVYKYKLVEKLTKQCLKVHPVAPYAVMGFTGNGFPLGLMQSISDGIFDTVEEAKEGRFYSVHSVAEQAAKSLKRALKKGADVKAIIVGFNLNNQGQPTDTDMYYIHPDFVIEHIEDNYIGLGARKVIADIVEQENIDITGKDSFKKVNAKGYSIFDFCSEEEQILKDIGQHDWHVGGWNQAI